MSIVLDTRMKYFAERLDITSSRMINDYGAKTIDEIIDAEAAQGNTKAIDYARELYHSPSKLCHVLQLTNAENRCNIIYKMSSKEIMDVLEMLDQEDLVMGLYFFNQKKLLKMLEDVDISELVNVVRGAFAPEQIVMMYKEEDMAAFFQRDELKRFDVIEQLKLLPPEIMINFIEGVTGRPSGETNSSEFIMQIAQMPTDQYRDFMSSIDPMVQRQLILQLTTVEPDYMMLFENQAYTDMLATLVKPDMVKPMIGLSQKSLLGMMTELPRTMVSIVGAQVDTQDFAEYLVDGHMSFLKEVLMI